MNESIGRNLEFEYLSESLADATKELLDKDEQIEGLQSQISELKAKLNEPHTFYDPEDIENQWYDPDEIEDFMEDREPNEVVKVGVFALNSLPDRWYVNGQPLTTYYNSKAEALASLSSTPDNE